MPSLLSENLIHLSDVAKRVPAGRGKRLHTSTVFRWTREGVRGPSGEKIRLESLKVGKYWFTSNEALERFITATNNVPQPAAPDVLTQTQRKRASDKAGRRLEVMGV
jgi:hypothetical protein